MAEVPVSDVLCDATEYLCKLGSNLRSRSQNLKEKRISKDKLRNTHAVRKAATKLLMMCELSKKSLENVEIGVRRVLGIVESSRRSPCVGAINKTSKTDGSKKEWFYIEYDSCKLRISKKILLEHYMSVKVEAKSMPVSMIEKYPVYYKCALYQKRKKTRRECRLVDPNNGSSKIDLKKGESLENIPSKEATGSEVQEIVQGKVNDMILELSERTVGKCDKKKNENSSEIDSDLPKPAQQSDTNAGAGQIQMIADKASSHHEKIRKSPNIQEPKQRKRDEVESAQSDDNSKNPKKGIDKNNTDNNASQGSSNVQEIDVSKEDADDSHSDISSVKPKRVEENQEPAKKINLDEKFSAGESKDKEINVEPHSENCTKSNNESTTIRNKILRRKSCAVEKDNIILQDKSKDPRDLLKNDMISEELKTCSKSINKKSSQSKSKDKEICIKPNSENCTKSDHDSTQNEMCRKKSHCVEKGNEKLQGKSESSRDHLQSDLKPEQLKTSSKPNNNKNKNSGSESDSTEICVVLNSESCTKPDNDHSKTLNEMSQKETHSVEKGTDKLQDKSENSRAHLQSDLKSEELKTSSKSNHNKKDSGSESDDKKLCVESNSENYTKSDNYCTHNKEIMQDKNEDSRSNLQSDLNPEELKTSLKSNCNKTAGKKEADRKVEDNNVNSRNSSKSPLSVMLLDSDSDSAAQPKKSKKMTITEKSQRKKSKKNIPTEPEVVNLIDDDDSPRKQNQLPQQQSREGEDSDAKTSNKPMIKLVSLNKLLKPDVIKNNLHEVNEKSKNKKAKLNFAYVQERKREVLAFKPKKFNVVVTRLPKFSDKYLRKYGLRKIIKHGSTIYKLTNELLNDTETNINLIKSGHSSKKAESREKIETIEIDLTDDTSMEKIIGKEIQEDLDGKNDNIVLDSSTTVLPDKDNKSECDKNNKQCVDRAKTPESGKKTDQTTPRSKRKAIMKSMEAKKMLLTHSSSSDTDDDQLGIALKAKLALLNGSSSDEDEIKKPMLAKRRRLVTPSDSDDSLKITKKLLKRKKFKGLDTEESSISQIDGTHDELSSTGSSKMGRSKTKVSSSSKQTSESVDSNDEINRLTNLNSLTRSRRRRPRGSRDAPARSTRRMPKAPPIQIEGDMLPLESSDSVSGNDSNPGDVEDLPPITLQELNGDDGINELAKEDLLAQSDSSSSQNDKANGSEEDKKEESDEDDVEDNVKSRRRKPHTISSDSEAGSSRRKADKLSDFDDSEEDSRQSRKKSKRKKKESDSDASLSSHDGSKKKRRRIKQVKDSDGSGSDTENEGKNKHGRKNIRKVMSKDQLEEATKKAARQEKERIARIAERQKTYNNVEFDESGKPDEVVLDKVVLDFDPETKEPLIQVDCGLVRKLKPHQANGIKFMWNACFESVKRIKKDRGSGCILAHCMGLGKTLQVVSLTHTLLVHSDMTKVKRVLVVCPLSTVLNWVNEFNMWLKHSETDFEVNVFELSKNKQNSERAFQLQQWMEYGGVCVLGYEMFRNLSADNNKKFKKKMLGTFQQALVDPGPDLVVCDEGHLLKNEKTSLSQSMNRVRTLRRIVLTGTPLQNNLKEYYCMVTFVKPNLLGKYNEYLNRFVNPITNGQYTDSTERDISIMKRRSHVLHTMLDGAVQRRDYGVLAPFLPPKHEYVLFITLTEIQTKLYQHYLDNYSRRPLPGKSSGFLFPDFQSLQRIWTHPLVLKYNSERYEIMQQKKRDKEEEDSEGSLADFIDDDSTPDESSTEESSDDLSDASDDSRKKSKKKKAAKKGKGKDKPRRGTRANPVEQLEEDKGLSDVEEVKYENPTEWWMKLVTDEELEDMRHSHKLLLLFDILRQCDTIGDKLLVFSQSLYSLDLIEHFLGKVDEATQDARIDEKLAGHVGSWSPGVDYFRLDGSTSCENRSIWCKNFNREDNPRARLFLISTRAGGLGINLVAANRVVIFDVSWNPSHDVQSIFRVYRFGQKKPCYVYRFLAMGTMEEKIYERQVTKQAISKRVIDEQQIDRHYAANDLAELYKFEPVPAEPRPTPPLPKDRLFAEMLKEREAAIFRFHEHDSLLENKEEETLSEEERKRAWEEFENEKRAPPPQAFQPPWAMTNGMAASLLQQQQQQLAYAALAAMIRKDMPNINDAQIRDMLPIICNANPGMFGGYDYGLMQKMSEIYKYAQPSMMNPSMMNPAINPASGMGTSSLQYEPPWQRQQQQQQQMRLQQLMQQQSMGAKYYAGGLGSRDPVAMALQQQRAREFLLGGGAPPAPPAPPAPAARPRGRPPLQPRAPPAQDVVNLADSD